jgi:Putative GTPase activating protein for Arf
MLFFVSFRFVFIFFIFSSDIFSITLSMILHTKLLIIISTFNIIIGVHISFVRSVSMDSWSEKQIEAMRKGGNEKCIAFLSDYGIAKNTPIQQKYNSPAAMLYKVRTCVCVCGWEYVCACVV